MIKNLINNLRLNRTLNLSIIEKEDQYVIITTHDNDLYEIGKYIEQADKDDNLEIEIEDEAEKAFDEKGLSGYFVASKKVVFEISSNYSGDDKSLTIHRVNDMFQEILLFIDLNLPSYVNIFNKNSKNLVIKDDSFRFKHDESLIINSVIRVKTRSNSKFISILANSKVAKLVYNAYEGDISKLGINYLKKVTDKIDFEKDTVQEFSINKPKFLDNLLYDGVATPYEVIKMNNNLKTIK